MSLEFSNIVDERLSDDYVPGRDNDERRLVVALGSGGMAGSFGGGAMEVLQDKGWLKVVDAITGSSIGSVGAAFGATGEADKLEEVFIGPLTESRFMASNLLGRVASYVSFRLDRTGNVSAPQNMTLMGDIIKANLNTESLRKSRIPVITSVTSLPELETISHDLRDLDDSQMIEFLTRGCAFPFVSGEYKGVHGITDMAIDGAFTLLASEQLAFTQNPTNILSIGLTPYSEWKYGVKEKLARRMVGLWLAEDTGQGLDIYRRFVDIGTEQAEYLKRFGKDRFNLEGALVEKIFPRENPDLPGRLTMDPYKLKRGFELGRQAMLAAIK